MSDRYSKIILVAGTLLLLLISPDTSAQYTWTRSTIGGGGGQPGLAVDPTNDDVAYMAGDLGGMYKTTDRGNSWQLIQNNLGSREIASIKIDPLDNRVVYVTGILKSSTVSSDTNGEIYRSRDSGNTWEVVHSESPETGNSIAIYNWPSTKNIAFPFDPADPSRFDSDDDKLTDVILIGGWGGKDAGTNSNGNSGIWKSTDEGNTFSQKSLGTRNIYFIKFDPDNPDTAYAGTAGDGLYKSINLGDAWEKVNIPEPNSHLNTMRISDIAIIPGTDTIYLAVDGGYSPTAEGGIYKSTNGGSTWTYSLKYSDILLGGSGGLLVLADNQDPTGNTAIAGFWRTSYALYMTTDGGNTWEVQYPEQSPSPPGPHWVDVPWIGPQWAFDQGNDGSIYLATWRSAYVYDRTNSVWKRTHDGIGNTVITDIELHPINDSIIYFAMSDSMAPFKSMDGGVTWEQLGAGIPVCRGGGDTVGDISDISISDMNPNIVFACGFDSGRADTTVCKSTDGGDTWTPMCDGLPAQTDPPYHIISVEMSPVDDDIVLLATSESRIYRSINGGTDWNSVSGIATPRSKFEFTDDGQTVLISGGTNIYISNDAGLTWGATTPNPGLSVFSTDVCATDKNKILASLNITGVYLSNDQGVTWDRIFDKADIETLPEYNQLALSNYGRTKYFATSQAVQFDPSDCNTIYVGHTASSPYTGLGLIRTADSGQSWEVISDNTIFGTINEIDMSADSSRIAVGGLELGFGSVGQCTPSWSCTDWSDWSVCVDGEQTRTRTCTDLNSCDPEYIETDTQSCVEPDGGQWTDDAETDAGPGYADEAGDSASGDTAAGGDAESGIENDLVSGGCGCSTPGRARNTLWLVLPLLALLRSLRIIRRPRQRCLLREDQGRPGHHPEGQADRLAAYS
jgi:photosystem II stability/assembly factor-like uncharacterized protein